jgi:hypothetical protein
MENVVPEHVASVEIIDMRTSDTLVGFETIPEAEEAFVAMVDQHPSSARFLAMVFFDSSGLALGSRMAEEFTPA